MPALVSYTHTHACTHLQSTFALSEPLLEHQCIYHVQCLVAIYFMMEPRVTNGIPDNSSMGKLEHLDNQVGLPNIYPKRALESLDHSKDT